MLVTLASGPSLTLTAPSVADGSVWLAPRDGLFLDPARWSGGVPGPGDTAIFGRAPSTRPFNVTLAAPWVVGSVTVEGQSPTLVLDAEIGGWGSQLLVIGPIVFAERASGDRLRILGGSLDLHAPPALAAGDVLALSGATARTHFQHWVVPSGTVELVDASVVPAPFPSLETVTIGDGGEAALTLSGDSVLQVGSVHAGRNGGIGEITLSDGAHVAGAVMLGLAEVGSVVGAGHLVMTGGASMGPPGCGVEHGTVSVADSSIYGGVSVIGPGTLALTGSAKVVGDVALASAAGGNAPALVRVTGRGTTCDIGVFEVWDGMVVIDDGATALIDQRVDLYGTNAAVRIEGEAQVVVPHMLLFEAPPNCSIRVAGPTTRLTCIDIGNQASGAHGSIRLSNGALLSADFIRRSLTASTEFGVGANGAGRISAGHVILGGNVEITADADAELAPGMTLTLIDASTLTTGLTSWSTPTVAGFPGLLEITSTSLSVRFIEAIDELKAIMPEKVYVGFEYALHAAVAVDGGAYDVSPQVDWSVEPPAIATITRTERLIALSEGTFTLGTTFGSASAETTLRVAAPPAAPPILLVSASEGMPGSGDSGGAIDDPSFGRVGGRVISADGRTVAYQTRATDLVDMDGTDAAIVVTSLADGTSELVSKGPNAVADWAGTPVLSRSGRYVAFSTRTPLSATAHAGPNDLVAYVHDRESGTTEVVSVDVDGVGRAASPAAISDDGRFVLFTSAAGGLVPGDMDGLRDVFLRDRVRGDTELVSVDANGAAIPFPCAAEDMTPDGNRVLFTKEVPLDDVAHSSRYMFVVKDRTTGDLLDVNGEVPGTTTDGGGTISANGRVVAFSAYADTLNPPAMPFRSQIVARDLETGACTFVSYREAIGWGDAPSSAPSVSDDGRFVSFVSDASNFDIRHDPFSPTQLYRYDLVESSLETSSVGLGGMLRGGVEVWCSVSADGRSIAFSSDASNLLPFDASDQFDVFVRRYGSFVVGDLDDDGAVDATDLAALLAAWGSSDDRADLNGDVLVDAIDLGMLLGEWTGR